MIELTKKKNYLQASNQKLEKKNCFTFQIFLRLRTLFILKN